MKPDIETQVRALAYRRRLVAGIGRLEESLRRYIDRTGTVEAAGYQVSIEAGRVILSRESGTGFQASLPLHFPHSRIRIEDYSPQTEDQLVSTPADVYRMLPELRALDREHFLSLHLSIKNRVNAIETVAIGTLSASLVHPREVYKGALLSNSAAIIVAHNHPSGDPTPSHEDLDLTQRLHEGGALLGIDLLDHLIIGREAYTSLREQAAIPAYRR